MGIFKKFKKNKSEELNNQTELNQGSIEQKESFVSDISLYEFENVDWSKFGSVLKQNRILPNSYPKKPGRVEIKLSEKNQPMVLLTFNSATSNSVREYLLLQDGVFQSINGVVEKGQNQDLINIWNKFKEEIRYKSYLNTNYQGYFHKMKSSERLRMSEMMMTYGNLFDLEQNFLEKYKDAKFDDFGYGYATVANGHVPVFMTLNSKNGIYSVGEIVFPFSPKTLEFCILHMTKGQKAEEGSDVEFFEEKCRRIQEVSFFDGDDWDVVIRHGKDIVSAQYEELMRESLLEQ